MAVTPKVKRALSAPKRTPRPAAPLAPPPAAAATPRPAARSVAVSRKPASRATSSSRQNSWRGSPSCQRPPEAPQEPTPPVITPESLRRASPIYPSEALFAAKKPPKCGLDPGAPIVRTVAVGVDVSGSGTRVCKHFLSNGSWLSYLGWVVHFQSPLFRIRYDDGDSEDVSGRELQQLVLPRKSRTPLSDPRLFRYEVGVFNWFDVPEFALMIDETLQLHGIRVPPCWTNPDERRLGVLIPAAPSTRLGYDDFVAAERRHASALLRDASNGMNAKATVMGYRLHFLKLFTFASARQLAWPIPADELGLYTALLGHQRQNASAPAAAVAAAGFVSRLNDWGIDYSKTVAAAPQRQQARIHKLPAKKVAAVEAAHVMAILSVYVFANTAPALCEWALTIGCAIGLGFKLLLRYDDLIKCRWDDGFCEVFTSSPAGPYIRFFLSGRKTSQYRGSFLDVAAPLGGSRGLYHALLRGKHHFKTGFVLRTVYGDGSAAKPEKWLGHGRFVAFLRAALLSIGFSASDVGLFAAHSLRAGGATAAAVGKLSQHEIAMVSATSSTCWLEWYDRRSLARRLQLSRAVGC